MIKKKAFKKTCFNTADVLFWFVTFGVKVVNYKEWVGSANKKKKKLLFCEKKLLELHQTTHPPHPRARILK
jgi:hypothetical protein